MDRESIRRCAAILPCGDVSWVFYGTQYGGRASIEAPLSIIKSEFSRVEGSKMYYPYDVPQDHYLHSRVQVCSGVPVLREFDSLNWVPNAAHLFFSPIIPSRGKDARTVHDIIVHAHEKWGFDLFPTLCVARREMHYIANIVYDRGNVDAKKRAVALMRDVIHETAKESYGEYRTHLLFADQAAETYSWNNSALVGSTRQSRTPWIRMGY